MKFICPNCSTYTFVSKKDISTFGRPICTSPACRKVVKVIADDGKVKNAYQHPEMIESVQN